MRLTRNFRLSEFTFSETAIRHGIDNSLPLGMTPNAIRMAIWLQKFRDRLCKKYGKDMPISITSGYRCPKLNCKVLGSKTSMHKQMLAVDLKVIGLTVTQMQREVIELMLDCPYDQCIDEYSGWLHLGLAADGDLPRMENLVARMRVGAFGRLKTEYTHF